MKLTQATLDEAIEYCHVIREGIIWIAETFVYERQYIGRTIPLDAVNHDNELDWEKLEQAYPERYKAFIMLELLAGLNNDFLHFTNHSLKSLHPASVAVSYVLARKPYKDSLSYLEYMYARPQEFMKIFLGYHENMKTKDLDNHLKRGNLRKDLLIESCKKLSDTWTLNIGVLNPDFNYSFRYDTEFTGFYDTATHLVTSRTGNATDDVNMNFIFLNQNSEDAERHTAHLTRIHLNCLSYGLEIMYQLLERSLKDFYDEEDFKKFEDYLKYIQFRKITANLAALYGHRLITNTDLDKENILKLLGLLKHVLKFECSACGSKKFKDRSLKAAEILIFNEVVLCAKCGYPAKMERPVRLTVE